MIIYHTEEITNDFIVESIRYKQQDNIRIQRLQDYYEDRHDILNRHYADSTKPNNRIVVNMCKEIADFLTGYLTGVPVTYENAPQIIIDTLDYNDNDNTTQSLALNMNICGYGVEMFYTDEDGIPRFTSVDPKEVIFIVDNTLQETIRAAIRVYPKDDEAEGYNVTLYTATDYTEYELTAAVSQLVQTGETTPHYFMDVPVILYKNNDIMSGSYEGIISLQNALNTVTSDEVNDFESFVDSYLVLEGMQGTTTDDLAQMKENRVILTDRDSRGYWLTKTGNTGAAKELRNSLTQTIKTLGNIPDVENLGTFGTSGIALRFKLIKTETQAIKQERGLFKGIQRKLELLYNILSLTDSTIGVYTDIKPIFERNFIMEQASAYDPEPIGEVNPRWGRGVNK